jgi:programmed cell death protein 5
MSSEYDNDNDYQKEIKKRLSKSIKEMQIEEQRKELMKQVLDTNAFQRLMNVKISNHNLYIQVVNVLISFMQSGRISGKLSEDQLISIITKMTQKPETRIEFKHK